MTSQGLAPYRYRASSAVSRPFMACGLSLLLALAPLRGDANSANGTNAVLSVGIHDSGHALVFLASSSNTENCATGSNANTVAISKDDPNFKALYSTALLAYAMGRSLDGWVNGCTDLWGNGGTLVPTATTLFIR